MTGYVDEKQAPLADSTTKNEALSDPSVQRTYRLCTAA